MKKSPLFFIGVGLVLMLVAVIATLLVWSEVQEFLVNATETEESASEIPLADEVENEAFESESTDEAQTTTTSNESTQVSESSIRASDLPLTEGQRATADTFGIDLDVVLITPKVQVCAAAGVGKQRYDAILAGDTPSFSESLKFLSCLR